jgi:hypothetical protein
MGARVPLFHQRSGCGRTADHADQRRFDHTPSRLQKSKRQPSPAGTRALQTAESLCSAGVPACDVSQPRTSRECDRRSLQAAHPACSTPDRERLDPREGRTKAGVPLIIAKGASRRTCRSSSRWARLWRTCRARSCACTTYRRRARPAQLRCRAIAEPSRPPPGRAAVSRKAAGARAARSVPLRPPPHDRAARATLGRTAVRRGRTRGPMHQAAL